VKAGRDGQKLNFAAAHAGKWRNSAAFPACEGNQELTA
jgi:hypothetical protein